MTWASKWGVPNGFRHFVFEFSFRNLGKIRNQSLSLSNGFYTNPGWLSLDLHRWFHQVNIVNIFPNSIRNFHYPIHEFLGISSSTSISIHEPLRGIASSAGSNLRILRVLRLTRLTRIFRVLRVVRFVRPLQTLVARFQRYLGEIWIFGGDKKRPAPKKDPGFFNFYFFCGEDDSFCGTFFFCQILNTWCLSSRFVRIFEAVCQWGMKLSGAKDEFV